jgi:hypothetical protein
MKRKSSSRPEPGVIDVSPGLEPKDVTEGGGLSRRTVLQRALGLAAVGAVGGTLLSEVKASPAMAAGGTVEPGGVAPTVVFLTDAPAIALDASLGNDFRVTINGSRNMGNPLNPLDGQKIVLQVTQGAGGSYSLTWGSSYEFSTGLPQPTLSTTAGDTDLLAFIYNAAKGKWLMAAFINGFTTVVLTPPPGTFRLFPSTNGPATAATYTGPFLAGALFEVRTGGTWLEGYWWWVCGSGQSTAAQKFALWQVHNNGAGTLVASATATSASLTPGQWNYIPLTTPVPLAIGATYMISTGLSNGFPITSNQFGAGEPYAAGIVNGPLTAFSDLSGSMPAPFGMNQGLFGTAGTDPTVNMPVESYDSSNFWTDLQIGNTAPAGTSYRLWPNYPTLPGSAQQDTTGYTLATEFALSASSTLDNIWFYSPPGVTALPSQCAIWNVATQSVVAGTDNTSPTWSGPAGSGWVSCPYSGVTLPAGDYKVAVFHGGGTNWFQVTPSYWGTGGPGAGGIATGPITAPSLTNATSPGQSTYNPGSWAYPLSYGSGGNGENFWVDVEVTPG